jgi:hypothetical protein
MNKSIFLEICTLIEDKSLYFYGQEKYYSFKSKIISSFDNNQTIDFEKELYDMLSIIGDEHSFWIKNEKIDKYEINDLSITYINKKLIIKVPFIFFSDDTKYTNYIKKNNKSLIRFFQKKEVKELFIDLRNNTGGNFWAMLAIFGFLFKNKIVGYFQYKDRNVMWCVNDSYVKNGSYYYQFETPPSSFNNNYTITVLINEKTCSSGEALCIAFKSISARIEGVKSGGYTTGNEEYILSDGSKIYLSECYFMDSNFNIYKDGINPDN